MTSDGRRRDPTTTDRYTNGEISVTEATDGLGREGDAIRLQPKEGFQAEYLFDPESGAMLAQRAVLLDPSATRTYQEIPAGIVISERDYIEEATVDSTEETGGE